eukprot:CAMPEP_0183416806 /NCGR_PEP_ID=MMETSP0370-20130417/24010_1 /TAXON_ID=268820 /ORGANISM="Peridinium aciculiferum, Strain PAER-2" /LENGTH=422 /DNA_ID=CAMNT_0025600343 /DNA_START=17 /DNA_END=1285 /DNA_ORIENTATION=+
MTEFRRASGVVEQLERLVAELTSDASVSAGAAPSDEARAKFVEARGKIEELAPTAEKMRHKCEARAELDELREKLSTMLPGAPSAEGAMKAAEDLVEAGGEGSAVLAPLLKQALELEGFATYGAKMVEKVVDLLQRFDVARSQLEGQLAPKLAESVAAAGAAEGARRLEEQRLAVQRAAEEERKAREEERRAVVMLLAENEHRLREKGAREAAERQAREEDERQKQQALAAAQAEEEALLRAEQEGEAVLAASGPEAACVQALAAMLAAPVGRYRAAVEGLHGMLGGIAAEPQDMSFRLIRVANEDFQENLGRRPGVWLFIRGVGFVVETRDALPSGLIASLGLPGGAPTDRFLILKEPDMMTAYAEWSQWHERIKAVAGFLHDLERLAFQRTAHLGQHGADISTCTVLSAAEVLQRWEASG